MYYTMICLQVWRSKWETDPIGECFEYQTVGWSPALWAGCSRAFQCTVRRFCIKV